MLNYDIALELLLKYGFSSTEHPYIFREGQSVGLCILLDDENYGKLQRKKMFSDINVYEEFLKKLAWMRDNATKYNVKMVLDNYEVKEPKIMFLRDNRPMLIGEMFNIVAYDERNEKKKLLDSSSRMLYEIGDLLLVYDEIKIRQLNEMELANSLRNDLRRKYFELQKEVNLYNEFNVEINLTLLVELITNNGMNEVQEVALKDRYNLYKVKPPGEKELMALQEEVWDLLKGLELNEKYYEACMEVKDLRNEMTLVQSKIDVMKPLNDDPGSFRVDLMAKFRAKNREFENARTFVYERFVESKKENINKKYAAYDMLDKNYLADFLRESLENNDYDELMSRFLKSTAENTKIVKYPKGTIIANLNSQYQALNADEQAILVLSNTPYFRELMYMINNIPNYDTLPIVDMMNMLSKLKDFNKIKSFYERLKERIDLAENIAIKQSVFMNISTVTFESFISSIINETKKISLIDRRMVINSDYTLVAREFENLDCQTLLFLTNNDVEWKKGYDYRKNIMGSYLIKCGVSVAYSPYYLDLGNIDTKLGKDVVADAFKIQVNPHFNLLVNSKNSLISKDDFYVTVADFYTNPALVGDISVVTEIHYIMKYLFCKATILDNNSAATVRSILNLNKETELTNATETTSSGVSSEIARELEKIQEQEVVNQEVNQLPQEQVQSNEVELPKKVDNNGGQ